MQTQGISLTLLDNALVSLKSSNTDKLTPLIRFQNSLFSINSIPLNQVVSITKLLQELQQSLLRQLPSTKYAIVTYSIIFKLISLLANKENGQNQEVSAVIRDCARGISRYSINCLNISLFSSALQNLSKLIRQHPYSFNLFYESFRELCVLPYTTRFTPIQLENISILVEFHVSKIAEIAVEYNAMTSIPMLYPVTSLFNVHSEPTQVICRVPEKFLERYPGIEKLNEGQLANILLYLIEKPMPRFPFRYGMPKSSISHFYSLWKAFENKMKEGNDNIEYQNRLEEERDLIKEEENVRNLTMEEVKVEEEEVEIANAKLIDLQKDDTVLGVVEFATDAIVRLCNNYEKSCHPDEKRLCEKIIGDILLMILKEVDLESIRLEENTLIDYLIHFTIKDNCKHIKLIIFLMFEFYTRKYNDLYLMLFKKILFQLVHPPQPGIITFFNQIPFIPRQIGEIEEILSMLRVPMEEDVVDQKLVEVDDKSIIKEEIKKEEKKMEMVISDNEDNIQTVQNVVNFTIKIIEQTPQSYVVLLPLLIKHLCCFPEPIEIEVINKICTEIYPSIRGGLSSGVPIILQLICESDDYDYVLAIVRLIYAMCLYQNDLLITIINSLRNIQVTPVFMTAFVGNFTLLLQSFIYKLFEEQNFAQYVHFITTPDEKINPYILSLLESTCDFYLPLVPDHQSSVRVQTIVSVILSKFLKQPFEYTPFIITILPLVNPPQLKQLLPWLIYSFESRIDVIETILYRLLSSKASRYKFEDIIVSLIELKTTHLEDYIQLLCSIVGSKQIPQIYSQINFTQSIDILISKKTDTLVFLKCLVSVIKISNSIKFMSLCDKLLRVIKTSELVDSTLPIFIELVELTSPAGINLLMLLSEEKMRTIMNEHPRIVQFIKELPQQDYAKLDKTVLKVIESLIKSN